MPLIKVKDKSQIVTDTLLISQLSKQGIYQDEVEFSQDYAMPATKSGERESGKSPYAKFYTSLKASKRIMVSSGLPMVNHLGQLLDVGFTLDTGGYRSKTNIFDAFVTLDGQVTSGCLNDQPDGRKSGQIARWSPTLYLNGKEVRAGKARLLDEDPTNTAYINNVIEWDYGICKRRIRLIEGHTLGSWVFPTNPNGEVKISYNQSGDFLVNLGIHATDKNTEIITRAIFDSAEYPFTVGDSSTFYPDADPETSSVDGYCSQSGTLSWADLIASAGSGVADSNAYGYIVYIASSASPEDMWGSLYRGLFLFDTSGLDDSATITGAVTSFRTRAKTDTGGWTPDVNIFSSNPASNTGLAAGDFDSLGSTAFATAVTYANLAASGYTDFTLNATGLAVIPVDGVAKLGVRNANYDVAASSPLWVAGKAAGYQVYMSEQGAGYKPKLVVTYVVPVSITISLAATADATGANTTPVGIVKADLAAAMPASSAMTEPTLGLISNPTITLTVPMAATSGMTTPISIVTAIMDSVMESTGLCIEPVLDLISNPTITLADVMASTGEMTEPSLSLDITIELTDVMKTGDGITYYGVIKRWSGSEWLPVTKVRMWSD